MNDEPVLPKTQPRHAEPSAGSTELDTLPLHVEDRYTSVEGNDELGQGGMGRVRRLFDLHLHREVAIKELLPEHTSQTNSLGPMIGSLFIREARVMARLEHPGVVPVYELARRADGTPFYAMRRIRGRSLAEALGDCTSLAERLTLLPHFIDVVQTMGYAHSQGVVHRDLKPANVMVGPFGETQVLDWGLANVVGEPDLSGGSGTPAYMSPEQIRAAPVNVRTDVWALGVMLFELLAARVPFDGTSNAVLVGVVESPTPSLPEIERDVPRALVAIVERAMQKDPSARFANAGEMAEALEVAVLGRLETAPSRRVWLAALAAVAVLGLLGVVIGGRDAEREHLQQSATKALCERQRSLAHALADASLLALRAKDTREAERLALAAGEHPLARGVLTQSRERGVPKTVWKVGVEAGCSSVARLGDVVACATLGGVARFALSDGQALPLLSVGPGGWQRAVVALSTDRLASAGDDRTVHVWSLGTGEEVEHFGNFDSTILSLASSGSLLFVGLRDGRVFELAADGRRTLRWSMPGPVEVLAAAPDLLAASGGRLVRAQFGSMAAPFEVNGRCGALVAEAGSVTVGLERSVAQVTAAGVRYLATEHRDEVTSVVKAGPTARLISADAAGVVQWWFGDWRREGSLDEAVRVNAMVAVDDRRLVVAPRGPSLELLELPERIELLPEESAPTFHAWWARGWFVSGLSDGRIRRYDVATHEVAFFESKHRGPVRSVAEVPGEARPERLRHLSGGDDGQVLAQRWNGEVSTLDSGPKAVTALAVSPDGSRAAWAFAEGTVVLWSLEVNREVSREPVGYVHRLAFSPDGRSLAAAREDKHIALYDSETGKARATWSATDGAALVIRWSGDGTSLFSAGADSRVTQWRAADGSVVRTLSTGHGQVTALDVSPTGERLAAGSDGEVYVWSLETGALWARVPADAGRWAAVQFVDAESLFAIGADRMPHLFRLD